MENLNLFFSLLPGFAKIALKQTMHIWRPYGTLYKQVLLHISTGILSLTGLSHWDMILVVK
jgi:hypothetical protein